MLTFEDLISLLEPVMMEHFIDWRNLTSFSFYKESAWIIRNHFNPLSLSIGITGRICKCALAGNSTTDWRLVQSWVSEVMVIIFILWPMGINKLDVISNMNKLSEEAMAVPRICIAVSMVRNIICNIDEIEAGTKMDIAALRFLFPRLSWLANELLNQHMDPETRECIYGQQMSMNVYPSMITTVLSSDLLVRFQCEMASTNKMGRKYAYYDEYLYIRVQLSNCLYLMEEAKFITTDLKKCTPASGSATCEDWRDILDMETWAPFLQRPISEINEMVKTAWDEIHPEEAEDEWEGLW
jgi:hypothetical protein